MNALDVLFDSLESEMKPTHDFYFHTASFCDPKQSGGQREWNLLIDSFRRPEWEANRILKPIRDMYLERIKDLLHPDIEKTECPYDKNARQLILNQRRMILQDCIDCLRNIRSVIGSFSDMSGTSYQESDRVSVVEFSDEHIPSIKVFEAQTYENGIDGTELADMFRKMKIKNKLYKKYQRPNPIHFQVAVHPSKERMVYGYLFIDSTNTSDCRTHTYQPYSGPFTEQRRIAKVVTMAVRPDMSQRVAPELLFNAVKHMHSLKCDRFEDRTNEYHREA